MVHNLDLPSQCCLDPLVEALFVVSTIGPDQLETWQDPAELCKQAFAAAIVVEIGLRNQNLQDQPVGIDQQVALAAFDLFASIRATNPALLGRLNLLTIHDRRAGSRLAPLVQAQ